MCGFDSHTLPPVSHLRVFCLRCDYNSDMSISELIARCISKNATLAVAESCTGGHVADLITNIPGVSAVFTAGVIAYSRAAKITILGVPPAVLQKYGLISEETAQAMALEMRLIAKADYAIATTGNLGPDVLEGKQCGLVYLAVSSSTGVFSRELHLGGDRAANKHDAALAALNLLAEVIDKEPFDDR